MMTQKSQTHCPFCGKEEWRYPSQINTYNFCSGNCRDQYLSKTRQLDLFSPLYLSPERLIADLQSLATLLGRAPKYKDLVIHQCHARAYSKRFGTLENALIVAELIKDKKQTIRKITPEYPHPQRYTDEELLNELKRVCHSIGHTPTMAEFRVHGRCSPATYHLRYGSWKLPCKLAGLIPNTKSEGNSLAVPTYYHTRQYDDAIIRLAGSYELRFAKVLDSLQVEWLSHGEFSSLCYQDADGKSHKYMPDFYIPAWGLFVETKGWYREKDKLKTAFVLRDNPGIRLIIVGKSELKTFELSSTLPEPESFSMPD